MPNFTALQIRAREKVWEASQKNEPVTLDYLETKALHDSIFQTGKELMVLRDTVEALRLSRERDPRDFDEEEEYL